jgi:hypothetical protein
MGDDLFVSLSSIMHERRLGGGRVFTAKHCGALTGLPCLSSFKYHHSSSISMNVQSRRFSEMILPSLISELPFNAFNLAETPNARKQSHALECTLDITSIITEPGARLRRKMHGFGGFEPCYG